MIALLCGVFLYLHVLERALVAWRPPLATWALMENIGVFVPWVHPSDPRYQPDPAAAATIHLTIAAAIIALVASQSVAQGGFGLRRGSLT